ncbi:MAG: GDP-mannose 4,6-dehydratase [Candidatus Omnitrophica bacterium]|nr:GDP-mannose 4,6-dehydratase [Candidatus Omnitrophota bacterium]
MKAIIFGVSGQDGYYLTQLLAFNGVEVIGVSRSDGATVKGDVSDRDLVWNLIKTHAPDYIFHLAANSTTQHSALFDNHQAISTGTLNILEGVRIYCPQARVFLSGSAMQFHNEGMPIDEGTSFEAGSPYAVARIQSVYAARYYRAAFGLKVYVGYLFNHDSPVRPEKHINQKVVAAVKRIAGGSKEKLELGNLDVKKEFNYAGDIISAMWTLVNQDIVFEAVMGCGIAYTIQDWVEYCFKRINRDWHDFVVLKKDFVPEYKVLVCNPRVIKSLGWEPQVNFYQLADMMMDAEA